MWPFNQRKLPMHPIAFIEDYEDPTLNEIPAPAPNRMGCIIVAVTVLVLLIGGAAIAGFLAGRGSDDPPVAAQDGELATEETTEEVTVETEEPSPAAVNVQPTHTATVETIPVVRVEPSHTPTITPTITDTPLPTATVPTATPTRIYGATSAPGDLSGVADYDLSQQSMGRKQ